MSTKEHEMQRKSLPTCVKAIIAISVVLVLVGIVGGLLCWLL